MHKKQAASLLALLAVVSLLLSACQPQTVVQTVVVTQMVESTPVERIVEVTPTAAPTPLPPEKASPAKRGDVVRMAILSDLDGTNPWFYNDITGSSYWNAVVLFYQYPTMFTTSDQRWDFVPNLADGMPGEIVKEGDFWVGTARLKKGLTWSDGSPLTAQDVAFTANTVLAFALQGNWVTWYNNDVLDHVEAVDDLNLRYVYKVQPGIPIWNYGVLVGQVLSKAYWEPKLSGLLTQAQALDRSAADFVEKVGPLVTELEGLPNAGEPVFGPIVFQKWESGAYVESDANAEWMFLGSKIEEYTNGAYHESNDGALNKNRPYEITTNGDPSGDKALELTWGPYFDTYLFPVYSQDAAYLALQNGEVDIVLNPSGVSQGVRDQLGTVSDVQLVRNAQNGFRYIEFNQAKPYFKGDQGKALRQAIACQIDLDLLSDQVLQRQVEPVYTLVPSGLTYWHNPDVPVFCKGMDAGSRLTEAVRILKEAGFSWAKDPVYVVDDDPRKTGASYGEGLKLPDGTTFPEITLQAPGPGYDPLRATSAVYIEQWLRQLGIPATTEYTPFNTIRANENSGDFDIIMLGWGLSAFPSYLCDFFAGATGVGDGSDNLSYVSPALNQQCSDFYSATDLESARKIAYEMQVTLATELPYITLFTNPVYDAMRTSIAYPYTTVFDGLQGLYSAGHLVMPNTAQ
jgi:peptide/nickel transport system substrate-binding protein